MGIVRVWATPLVAAVLFLIEAARFGCDVYASDLNPIACIVT